MKESILLKVITPDEQFTYTIKQVKEELAGITFRGPGWYSRQGTWMLAIATETKDVYTFMVFFDRDPRRAFYAMAKALVHLHDR